MTAQRIEPTKYETIIEMIKDKQAVAGARQAQPLADSLKSIVHRCLTKLGWPEDEDDMNAIKIIVDPYKGLPFQYMEGALVIKAGGVSFHNPVTYKRDGQLTLICNGVTVDITSGEAVDKVSAIIYDAMNASMRENLN